MNSHCNLLGHNQPKLRKTSAKLHFAMAIAAACIASVQFGYHIAELNAPQGVIPCARVSSKNVSRNWWSSHGYSECIELTDIQYGAVTSVFSLGGLLGSYGVSYFADRYGRKTISMAASFMALVGSAVLSLANSYSQLMLGRTMVGIASGTTLVMTPIIIKEISPVNLRGSMGTLNQFSINLGILLTQLIAAKYSTQDGWRWILIAGALLALLNFFMWLFVHETPQWLLRKRDINGAEVSLFHIRGGDSAAIKQEVEDMQRDLESENFEDSENLSSFSTPTLKQYFTESRFKKPRRAIMALLMGQQFCGINSIIFYGVKVLSSILPNHALLMNILISVVNLTITGMSSLLIDKHGRKPLLLLSTFTLAVASLLISMGILNEWVAISVFAIFSYIGAFAIGLGPIPFLIVSELSAGTDVATAQSYGTICNWLATFVVGYAFPPIHARLGGYVYMLFGLFAIVLTKYIWCELPETRGKAKYQDVWNGY